MTPKDLATDIKIHRFVYLDSIRGLAALQVLLLHVFTAFFPLLVYDGANKTVETYIHHSPLFLFYNGYLAVDIFFVLSGIVLTFAFQHSKVGLSRVVLARYLRLAIPAFFAFVLALGIYLLVGTPNVEVGKLTGSEAWLSTLWKMPDTVAFFLQDAFLNSIFLGYKETSVFTILGFDFPFTNLSSSYVSPIWTLNLEFYGSLLVLLLVIARKHSSVMWLVLVIIISLFLIFTHFACFVAGHLIAIWLKSENPRRLPWSLALALLLLGCTTSVLAESSFIKEYNSICLNLAGTTLPCSTNYLQVPAAILVFAGLLQFNSLLRIMQNRALVYVGRLSFSIYLVHWPLVMGIGPAVYLMIAYGFSDFTARAMCALLIIMLTFLLAIPFSVLDDKAISISRWIKRRTSSNVISVG